MRKLCRLRFESIGHRDARLAPIELDFTADDMPTDSVLWLRNGGGKSSILNLFFALLRPDRREFLGSEADGRDRRLEDYVQAEDTAHVIAEWEQRDGRGSSKTAERIVTGMVLEWRDRTRSTDVSRLRRTWYAFVADPDSLTFDDVPYVTDGRRSSLARFVELLRERGKADVSLELVVTDTVSEWQRALSSLGLDPEVFRYQLQMNRREGAAHDLFRFSDARKFIDFLLGLVVDPAEASQVAANLQTYAQKLAEKPVFQLEASMVGGALERLRTLSSVYEERQAIATDLDATRTRAAALRSKLDAASSAAIARAMSLNKRADELDEESREHDRRRRQLNDQEKEVRKRGAELAVQAAEKLLDDAIENERHAAAALAAWHTAEILARRNDLKARVDATRRELEEEQNATRPVRDELALAGGLLLRALEAAICEVNAHADVAQADASEADREARAAAATREQAREQRASCTERIHQVARDRSEADRALDELRAAAIIMSSESVAAGAARLDDEASALTKDITDAKDRLEVVALERQSLSEKLTTNASTASKLESLVESLGKQIDVLTSRVYALASHPRLLEAAESDTVELWAAGNALGARLTMFVSQADDDLARLEIEGHADRLALAALDIDGLLPCSDDVETVLNRLRAAGIPCSSGWRHLAESVPAAAQRDAIARRPDVANGIILTDAHDLGRVRSSLDGTTLGLSTAVAIADASAFDRDADATTIVVEPVRALYDRAAGAGEHAIRAERVERLDSRRQELRLQRDGDSNLREELRAFLAEVPAGTIDDLTDRRQKADRDIVEARATEAEIRRTDALLARQRAELEERTSSAQERLTAIAGERERVHQAAELAERAEAGERLLDDLEVRVRELTDAIVAADHTEETARDRRTGLEREAADHRSAAKALEAESTNVRVSLSDLEARPGEPESTGSLVDLRARFRALDDRYRALVSASVLAHAERELSGQLEEVEKILASAKHHGSRNEAEKLLVGAQATDADWRAAQVSAATGVKEAAMEGRIRAETATEAARRTLEQLRPGESRMDLPDDLKPSDPAGANTIATRLAVEAEQASSRNTSTSKEAADVRKAGDSSEREAERFVALCKRISDTAGDVAAPSVVTAFEEDAAAGERATDSVLTALRSSTLAITDAEKKVADAADDVRRFAMREEFDRLRGKLRDRLIDDDAEVLAARSGELAEALSLRAAEIEKHLIELAEHQNLVVQALAGVVDDALRLLRRAETSSRLPESLDGWAARPFIQIRFADPDMDEELFGRLSALVDRVVADGSVPEGIPLLLRAVHDAVGVRGFDVTILKPDAVLRPERLPVSAMTKFSDGQQLTAAVLLYCSLARLRARTRGRETSGGVLVLDNPIGTCSDVALLALQRRVAALMGVQLIYTTGVKDLDALAALPNRIRLRNDRVDTRTGRRHVVADSADGVDGSVTATRVWRRERVAT